MVKNRKKHEANTRFKQSIQPYKNKHTAQQAARQLHFYLYGAFYNTEQLHSDNIKIIQHRSIILLMSPTKQAKSQGNNGKEPKLHHVTEWRKKNLGRNQTQSGAS